MAQTLPQYGFKKSQKQIFTGAAQVVAGSDKVVAE
jgi:hypothetical protein